MFNKVFTYTSADTVAETWDGVKAGGELYCFLWNEIVSQYPKKMDYEGYGGEGASSNNVSDYWDTIPQHLQEELNRLADIDDAEYEAWKLECAGAAASLNFDL